jgi:hypothetical protein
MHARLGSALLLALLASSCASLDFEPSDGARGTFRSRALAFTFLGHDYPQSALLLARANASDSGLPALEVERERVFPYFWKMDFLLDVISVRYASVSGTYGPAEKPMSAPANTGSTPGS